MTKLSREQMKQISEHQFQLASESALSETTPAEITSHILDFSKELVPGQQPVYVPVIKDSLGLYGFCSDGVLARVAESSGCALYGWTIWEWPKVLITAEFHAVWQRPDGEIVDITPKPAGENQILFLLDTSIGGDYDFDLRPTNRIYITADLDKRDFEVSERIAGMSSSKKAYENRRAAERGVSLRTHMEKKWTSTEFHSVVSRFAQASKDFDEHSDTLGGAGVIHPDKKFFKLQLRRLDLQRRMYRHLGRDTKEIDGAIATFNKMLR